MWAYLDQLFADVGPTQQLFDLKEELTTNIKEKIADLISSGMDEEQAYKEALISLGDLSGLVEEMRRLGQDQAKQKSLFFDDGAPFHRRNHRRSFADPLRLFLFSGLLVFHGRALYRRRLPDGVLPGRLRSVFVSPAHRERPA